MLVFSSRNDTASRPLSKDGVASEMSRDCLGEPRLHKFEEKAHIMA